MSIARGGEIGPFAAAPPGPRVLVVDDSPTERMALGRLLKNQGYDPCEVGDGEAAVDLLKNGRVDAVLLDLQMPGVDGFDVLSYLQEHRRALPVILLSGLPFDQIQSGMRRMHTPELPPLLLKPIDTDQLFGVLELLLNGGLPTNGQANGSTNGSAS